MEHDVQIGWASLDDEYHPASPRVWGEFTISTNVASAVELAHRIVAESNAYAGPIWEQLHPHLPSARSHDALIPGDVVWVGEHCHLPAAPAGVTPDWSRWRGGVRDGDITDRAEGGNMMSTTMNATRREAVLMLAALSERPAPKVVRSGSAAQ